MSKRIIAICLGLLMFCVGPMAVVSAKQAAVAKDVTIKVNGKIAKLSDPLLIVGDRLNVPAARVAALLGASASWDRANEELALRTASNDLIKLGNGVPVVYFNKARFQMKSPPFLNGGRLYMPLNQLAALLRVTMKSNAEADVVELAAAPPEEVKIAAVSLSLTGKEAGGGKAVPTGLKPARPFTEAEYKLLAKLTMVEAGYESYEGQLAVVNVVLNRVKDPDFPDSIREVIYSGKQFPPAHNGLLDKSKPNKTALRAAKDALNGKNNVGNAVYFYDPDVSKGSFWSSLDVVATIGSHRFAS